MPPPPSDVLGPQSEILGPQTEMLAPPIFEIPPEAIVDRADQTAADLIVMGTHGQGAIAEMLIGSTAKRVVGKSSVPVLVIRLP